MRKKVEHKKKAHILAWRTQSRKNIVVRRKVKWEHQVDIKESLEFIQDVSLDHTSTGCEQLILMLDLLWGEQA